MPKNNSTPEMKESINQRIKASVRQGLQPRTITIVVSEELAALCACYKTTPEDLIKGFVKDLTLDQQCDASYARLFYQAAKNYLSIAHGITRIVRDGKHTERPLPRTFN